MLSIGLYIIAWALFAIVSTAVLASIIQWFIILAEGLDWWALLLAPIIGGILGVLYAAIPFGLGLVAFWGAGQVG